MPSNNSKNGWSLNRKVSIGTVLKIGTLIVMLIVAAALTNYRLQQVEAKAETFLTKEKFTDFRADVMEPICRDIAELKRDVKQILKNQGDRK